MKYSEAIAFYRQSIQAKHKKDALKYIKLAVQIDPKQLDGWIYLLDFYLNDLGQANNAEHVGRRALKLYPNTISLELLMVRAWLEQSNYKESFELITKILQSDPVNSQAFELLDKLYIANKNMRPQIDQFRNTLFKQHLTAGQQAFQQNRLQDAVTAYEKSIQIIPHQEEVMDELSRLYFRIGNFAASQNYVSQLLVLHPNNIHLLNLHGYNAENLDLLEDAYSDFHTSLKLNPAQNSLKQDFQNLLQKLVQKYNADGDILYKKQKWTNAISMYQKSLRYLPGDQSTLSKIQESQKALDQSNLLQQNVELADFLGYLHNQVLLNEQIPLSEMLSAMPSQTNVSDITSLNSFLNKLISSNKINAKLSNESLILYSSPDTSNEYGTHPYQTIAVKNPTIPVMILRDGVQNGSEYLYTLKIQNNRVGTITEIKAVVYFPESHLKMVNLLTPSISFIDAGQMSDLVITFNIKSEILEGQIMAVVTYFDELHDLQTQIVSPHNIENVTASISPLVLDSSGFAEILMKSQKFSNISENFVLQKSPEAVYGDIQKQLEQMHFHIQQSSKAEPGTGFSGFIHSVGASTTFQQPVLLEIALKQAKIGQGTEISVKTASSSPEVSRIIKNHIKNSVSNPRCPSCHQIVSPSIRDQLQKGKDSICEYCGSTIKTD